jgi:hypothetical protein
MADLHFPDHYGTDLIMHVNQTYGPWVSWNPQRSVINIVKSQFICPLDPNIKMCNKYRKLDFLLYTGQFKNKVTLSRIYNEVTSEPTITRCTTIVRKTLKVCFCI